VSAGRDRGAQVLRNSLSGGGRFAVGAVTALLVTPFALDRLGDARFGLWALAGALLGLLRLLDLGLNRALTREVARAEGRGDLVASLPAVQTARLLALALGGLIGLLAWRLHQPLVDRLFVLTPALRAEAHYIFLGTVAVAALEGAFAPYQASLDGIGRMDLSNAIDGLVQRLLSPLAVILVLGAGWGLAGLVWKNLAAALLAGLAYARLLRRHAPQLAGGPPRIDRATTHQLLRFGRHVQIVNLGSALVEPVAKTLLGRGAGLEAVALYELASRVTGQLGGAFMALSNAVFPAAAALAATAESGRPDTGIATEPSDVAGSRTMPPPQPLDSRAPRPSGVQSRSDRHDAALVALHQVATRYTAWLVLPAWAILAALAPAFVAAWVGPNHAGSARLIGILAAGWALALVALPAFLVAQAGGAVRLSTIGGMVTSGVSIGLCLLLAGPYGSTGIALAISAGLATGGLVTLTLFARRFKLRPSLAFPVGWPVWAAAFIGAATSRVLVGMLPVVWLDRSLLGLAGVAASGLVGLASSALLLALTGQIGAGERAWLTAWWRGRQRDEKAA